MCKEDGVTGETDGQPAAAALMRWAMPVLADDAVVLALVDAIAVLIAVVATPLVGGPACP